MSLSSTAFTVLSVQITWKILIVAAVLAAYYVVFGLVLEKKPRIRIIPAFSRAFRLGWQNKGDLFRFLIVEGCLMLIGLVPLMLLPEPEFGGLVWLAYPIMLMWLAIARMNAAAVMQDALAGGRVFSHRLMTFSDWRSQVKCGIKRLLLVLIWIIPLFAGLGYAFRLYIGEDNTDGFKVLQMVQDFGKGDVMTGVWQLFWILIGLIFIVLIGFGFHSGVRHALALGDRKMVNGHHGKIVLGWVCSLVVLAPMWAALAYVIIKLIPVLNNISGVVGGTVEIPKARTLALVLAAGVVLTLPLFPVRSLIIAGMIRQIKDGSGDQAS